MQNAKDQPAAHLQWADETDTEVPLSAYGPEDWPALLIFWALFATVFLQFFTRYVLNDSFGWTEEVARYLLIGVTFVGASLAVRKNTHIHVEFIYAYLPRRIGRPLSTLVDLLRIIFFAWFAWLTWKITQVMHYQRLASIDLPQSLLYGVVLFGAVCMTLRSVAVAVRHWREGDSDLTRVCKS